MAKENPKRITQMRKLETCHCLLWLLNHNFSPVSFSLDNPNTIYYLEVALPIFPYFFLYNEMAYLPLYPKVYNFSYKVWKIIYMPTLK